MRRVVIALCLAIGAIGDRSYWSVETARYVGGGGDETVEAVTIDRRSNVYIVGSTNSPDFPIRSAVYPTRPGMAAGFLTKLNGHADVVYSTYLPDTPIGVAVDRSENVYVATRRNGVDSVMKISSQGTGVMYSVAVEASRPVGISALAVDSAGDVVLVGTTPPGLPSARLPVDATDVFVAKVDSAGRFMFRRFLGGAGRDTGTGIAVDASDNIYLVGTTNSRDFVTSPDAFQHTVSGNQSCYFPAAFDAAITRCVDAFVMKLDASGSRTLYSTLLGGEMNDEPERVANDEKPHPPVGRAECDAHTYLARALADEKRDHAE